MIYPVLIAFAVLTAIYVIVSIWSRSVRREKLENEWDEGAHDGDRDAFIQAGLRDYDRSLRRKLILGIYVVPLALVLVLVYVTNFM
jgi:Ca2+/Na+ antiporter